MNHVYIDMAENGYRVFSEEHQEAAIEGITEWETACEVHEMLTGELEEEAAITEH